MSTINAVNTSLSGQTGTGSFVGSTSPTIATPTITDGTYNVLTFVANGTVANYFRMYGGQAGTPVNIGAIGSDPNISMNLITKGTGAVIVYSAATATAPFVIKSGTSTQHTAAFLFTDAATSPQYTFADNTMTIAGTALAYGGTNANLTASNGGIVYSTASAMAILAGTATGGQLLTSGASTTPAWTTTTYPATNAINTLLYASSANVMAALATANSSVLVTSAGGVPSLSTTLPSGIAATNMSLTTPTLGAATATSITFSPTTGGIVGTTTNDSAGAGKVGEVISSSVGAATVSLSTGTPANATSISLTAGDWTVWGNISISGAAGTLVTTNSGWISQTSATLPASNLRATKIYTVAVAVYNIDTDSFCVPSLRVQLSGTTTIYLSAQSTFSTSTSTCGGQLYARRER